MYTHTYCIMLSIKNRMACGCIVLCSAWNKFQQDGHVCVCGKTLNAGVIHNKIHIGTVYHSIFHQSQLVWMYLHSCAELFIHQFFFTTKLCTRTPFGAALAKCFAALQRMALSRPAWLWRHQKTFAAPNGGGRREEGSMHRQIQSFGPMTWPQKSAWDIAWYQKPKLEDQLDHPRNLLVRPVVCASGAP